MGGGDTVADTSVPVGLTIGGFVPFAKQLQNQLKTLGRAGRKESRGKKPSCVEAETRSQGARTCKGPPD